MFKMSIITFCTLILLSAAAHAGSNTIALTILNQDAIEVGKPATITLHLSNIGDNSPVTLKQLKEVHTKRFHALIIDETLSDYHHEHPVESKTQGDYSFSFIPQKPGPYRIWADLTPLATGKQEYAMADINASTASSGTIKKMTNNRVTVNGLTFTLSFDAPLKAGQATMGKVTVTKNDKHFTKLEPVMGAYAHIVGFSEDRQTVTHIHPMGEEPTKADQRSGPELQFHIEPAKAGFIKLFVQTKINGHDLFAPFGVMVK